VGVTGCEMLQRITRDCRAVLLCATEAEAELLRVALLYPERHTVAAKTIYVGELEADHPGGLATVRVVLAITGCDKANAAHLLTCLLQAMDPPPSLVLQTGIAGALPSPGPGPGAGIGDIVIATQETYSDTGASSPEGWLSAADIGLPLAAPEGIELGGVFPLDACLTETAQEIIDEVEWPESVRNGVSGEGSKGSGSARGVSHEVSWPVVASRPDGSPAVLLGPCVTSSQATGLLSHARWLGQRFGALAESMEGAAAAHVCALYGVQFLEVRGISNLVTDRERDSWQVKRAAAVAGWASLAVVAGIERLPLCRTDPYVEF
jgi:futalosine hydrolase